MAVRKLKAKKVIDFALPLMQRDLILPLLVNRFPGENFKGAKGDTVTLRMPGKYKATARDYDFRGRTGPIVLDDIFPEGATMSVKLNKHVVSATGLEDEHFTLDDIQFATEVTTPMVTAVGENIEAKALDGFHNASIHPNLVLPITATDDPALVAAEAKRLLSSFKVAPVAGRVHLIGTDIAAAWAASDRLTRYDSVGQAGTPALREAIIGRLMGDPVVVHNGLAPDEGYYFHSTGITLATVAPSIPRGVTFGQTASFNGIGMRVIQDYDSNYLRDRVVASCFAGVNEFRDERQPDGSWIFEVGDLEDDEFEVMGIDPTDTNVVHPVGFRKNVRLLKYDTSGFGSLMA